MRRRPAVATPRMIGRVLAFLYAASAVVGLVSYFLTDHEGDRQSGWLLVVYVACLVLSPVLLPMRQNRLWVVNLTTGFGTALVTLAVHLMGNGAMAVAGATFYLLVVIPSFYLYSRPIAWSQALIVGALALFVLHGNVVLGPAETAMGAGVAAVLTVAISWLVRASDLAETDYVTGLPNLRGFEAAARSALREAPAHEPVALILIDLDAFRAVSDRYGSTAGDDVLHSIARRWQRLLPERAVLARQESDEFALLICGEPAESVEQSLAAMREVAACVTFCAGVAWAASLPGGARESLSMLKLRADAAVYEAKRRGPAQTAVSATPRSIRSGLDIRAALADGQFALYYQPIIDLHSGSVDKAEALLRWLHPVDGLIAPDDFIAVAEQTGVMLELGDWVLATACRDAAGWEPNVDGRPIVVSINASGVELHDPSYAGRVLAHVAGAGLRTDRVLLELVESDFNVNSSIVRANLAALTGAGVSLAIDDFGTGYSNLSRLDQMQVQVLKIDRSFVGALTGQQQQMPVIDAILAMGRALKLQVVAEGVETPEQAAWLRSRGCSHAQGYLYGEPAPQVSRSAPGRVAVR